MFILNNRDIKEYTCVIIRDRFAYAMYKKAVFQKAMHEILSTAQWIISYFEDKNDLWVGISHVESHGTILCTSGNGIRDKVKKGMCTGICSNDTNKLWAKSNVCLCQLQIA